MFKSLASALALTAVLALTAAPASANSRHGFGLGALAIGVIGAVVGAEIVSHSEPSYRPHFYRERDCFSRNQNLYDGEGAYVGHRSVNACD